MVGRFVVHRELDRFAEVSRQFTATAPHQRHFVTNILTEVHDDMAPSRAAGWSIDRSLTREA
jgi:hypothetical protein